MVLMTDILGPDDCRLGVHDLFGCFLHLILFVILTVIVSITGRVVLLSSRIYTSHLGATRTFPSKLGLYHPVTDALMVCIVHCIVFPMSLIFIYVSNLSLPKSACRIFYTPPSSFSIVSPLQNSRYLI